MAFWGVEVKPGRPYTHSSNGVRGRLRISQATLGIGSSTKKSLVQCNVGDKSPVFLCALLPDKTESLQLDLEFEEAEDVVFSVIGPRSIYLTGYYVRSNGHLQDDTESYGEDIANSEGEETNRLSDDDDEYEDSFINDGEPEIVTPSPTSSGRADEEAMDTQNERNIESNHKGCRRMYQSVDSGNETNPKQQNARSRFMIFDESDDEDDFLISSKCKTMKPETEGRKSNKGTVRTGKKVKENDGSYAKGEADDAPIVYSMEYIDEGTKKKDNLWNNAVLQVDEVDGESKLKQKKKRKETSQKEKVSDVETVNKTNVLKEDSQKDEGNANNINQDLLVNAKQDIEEPKKKRKDVSEKENPTDDDTVNNVNALQEKEHQDKLNTNNSQGLFLNDKEESMAAFQTNALEERANQDEPKVNNICQDRTESDKQGLMASVEKESDVIEFGPENDMKTKKRRKEHPEKDKDSEANGLISLKEDNRQVDADTVNNSNALQEKANRDEPNTNNISQDLIASDKQDLMASVELGSEIMKFDPENDIKPKKKKKERSRKDKGNEGNGDDLVSLKEDNRHQAETKAEADTICQYVPISKDDRRPNDDFIDLESDVIEFGPENDMKTKKRRKEHPEKDKDSEANGLISLKEDNRQVVAHTVNNSNALQEKANRDEPNISQYLIASDKQDLMASAELGSEIMKFDSENDIKPKKKNKERSRKDKGNEGNGDDLFSLKEDNRHQAETKAEADTICEYLPLRKDDRRPKDDFIDLEVNQIHESLLRAEVGPEKSPKAKKKRKERAEVKADITCNDLLAESGQSQKLTINKSDIAPDQLPDGNPSKEKKAKKKRRKKTNSEQIEENIETEVKDEKDISKMEVEVRIVDAELPEMRVLSNGLIIEELVTGNSLGKVATIGRKVKIQYTAKLRETGEVIDSNIGKSPHRFRLGDKEVIEGLSVGLEGMRAGDKRRLIIPPSLSSGGQGIGENIPPNSSLVYEAEMLSVH